MRPAASDANPKLASAQPSLAPITLLYVVNVAWFFLSHRLPLALAAANAGYRVHIATTVTDPADRVRLEDAGVEVHDVSFARSGTGVFGEMCSIIQLVRLYSHLKPTIVHHVTVKPVIYGSMAARWCRIPCVVNAVPGLGHVFSSATVRNRALRVILLRLYKFALRHPNTRVVFQNAENKQLLVDAGVVAAERGVLIRGSGVDLDAFALSPEPGEPVTVVLAARMLKDKGVEEFVEAARRLRAEGHRARFRLVGDPDPMNPGSIPREILQAWHSEGGIEWLGFRTDMPKVLAASNVVCLPTYYGEGLPKVLLEAAACGRPIVTTDIPGCRDIGRDGINAIVVPPRDVEALVTALRELIQNRALRERMGRAGREIVEREFGESTVVARTMSVYRELIGA
jgi:glycosyltransferase involved in cell wall biosynthesis